MTPLYLSVLKSIVARFPAVVPYLKGRARWVAFMTGEEHKSYDYFLRELERMVRNVYGGHLGGEFIDIMASLLYGQMRDAVSRAWQDEGLEEAVPSYLWEFAEQQTLGQYDYVDGFYRDIADARTDGTPIEPLLARCPLWANRWTETYNEAVHLIQLNLGGKERWVLGQTEHHCWICKALNGIVAYAWEWEQLGVRPQNAPNPILSLENGDEKGCGGWECDCSRQPTDKRRSPKAFEMIMNIVNK